MSHVVNNPNKDIEIKNKNFILEGFKLAHSKFDTMEKMDQLFGLFQFKNEQKYKEYKRLTRQLNTPKTKSSIRF